MVVNDSNNSSGVTCMNSFVSSVKKDIAASVKKANCPENDTVTIEYIVERIKAMDVLVLVVGMGDIGTSQEEFRVARQERKMITSVHICPSMLPRLMNDSSFREEQFANIKHIAEMMKHPRVIATAPNGVYFRLNINPLSQGVPRLTLADMIYNPNRGGLPDYEYCVELDDGEEESAEIKGSRIDLLQMLAQRFAGRGHILAMQNQLFLFKESFNS